MTARARVLLAGGGALAALALVAGAGAAAGAAAGGAPGASAAAADWSGSYRAAGSRLSLLVGEDAAIVSYSAAFDVGGAGGPHVCECASAFRRVGPGRFVLEGPGGQDAVLEEKGKALVLTPGPAAWAGCCGAGWAGDRFPRASLKRPRACAVSRAADLRSPPAEPGAPPTGAAAAAKGERVDVVDLAADGASGGPDADVMARLVRDGKRAVGLLRRADVACGKR